MLLLMTCLLAFDLAPRIRGWPAAGALAFAAAERMIDRIHRHAADTRAAAEPARLPGLADGQQLVLGIADFADRGEALAPHHPHLRRAEAQRDVVALFGHDLGARSRAAAQLAAARDLQLDVVYRRAQRNLEQRHRVAGANVRTGPRDHRVADVQPFGREDVALLPVRGMQNLSRRKSMRRYCRLCPPLIYRLVMWPLLLRPPVRRSGSSSVFSGSVLVISEKSETERKRVAGVIGRNCRIPI